MKYSLNQEDPLPVELNSFNVKCKMHNVELNWQTATEVNNYGFEIERAIDNGKLIIDNWEKIGFVAGHGNSNSPKDYSFIDKDPTSGIIKYRLKQIDTDGSFSYSNEVEINIEAPREFSLKQNYPNPFNPSTKINWQSPVSGYTTLKVYDVLGNEVATLVDEYKDAGSYEVEFNAVETRRGVSLPSGVYFYKLQAGEFVETKKMILMK
ncbi:T9SS type A sorting domain-containing protein [Ignavibacterium album]|nr:T9SS type A sorting domain-containing protein [Ignavibacterium album]